MRSLSFVAMKWHMAICQDTCQVQTRGKVSIAAESRMCLPCISCTLSCFSRNAWKPRRRKLLSLVLFFSPKTCLHHHPLLLEFFMFPSFSKFSKLIKPSLSLSLFLSLVFLVSPGYLLVCIICFLILSPFLFLCTQYLLCIVELLSTPLASPQTWNKSFRIQISKCK
jgi:hypothetical protein